MASSRRGGVYADRPPIRSVRGPGQRQARPEFQIRLRHSRIAFDSRFACDLSLTFCCAQHSGITSSLNGMRNKWWRHKGWDLRSERLAPTADKQRQISISRAPPRTRHFKLQVFVTSSSRPQLSPSKFQEVQVIPSRWSILGFWRHEMWKHPALIVSVINSSSVH